MSGEIDAYQLFSDKKRVPDFEEFPATSPNDGVVNPSEPRVEIGFLDQILESRCQPRSNGPTLEETNSQVTLED